MLGDSGSCDLWTCRIRSAISRRRLQSDISGGTLFRHLSLCIDILLTQLPPHKLRRGGRCTARLAGLQGGVVDREGQHADVASYGTYDADCFAVYKTIVVG